MIDIKEQLLVNGDRLWSTIERSGEIGLGRTTGLCRLALTDADKEMRDVFMQWCKEAGCSVTVDQVGNIFARHAGADDSLAPVVIGSHLDTQVAGGKYDGILGVLAGLEVVRTLNDNKTETQRPIEVVCWTNEEGARFNPSMIASGAFSGIYDVDWVHDQKDDDGIRFGDELKRIGYDGDTPVGGRTLDSYFELHIEQGPLLEAEGIDVGFVIGGFKTYGMNIDVRGECAHSGPTPMDKRKNALIGASMLAVEVNDIGWRYHPDGRSTVPRMQVWPNKAGILPEWVQITVDFRHPDPAAAKKMVEELKQAMPKCCERANVEMEIVQSWEFGDEVFDSDLLDTMCDAAGKLNIPHKEMMSLAGHDAYYISLVAPTALIFSPCKDGITHNEAEHIEPEYTLPSVNVLLNAVIERANRIDS